jgi:DnaJ-class molecular chaperone
MNPYTVLGVDKNATAAQIKDAYQKLSLKYHPQRSTLSKEVATEKFNEVVNAYNILSDATKRARFDQTGSTSDNPFDNASQGHGQQGGFRFDFNGFGGNGGFSDMFFGGGRFGDNSDYFSQFSQMFGGGRHQGFAQPETAEIKVSIEDIFNGSTKTISWPETKQCTNCTFFNSASCSVCKGRRHITKEHQYTVKIPAGAKPNSSISIDKNRILVLDVQSSNKYQINNSDLITEFTVPLSVLQTTREVTLYDLDGKTFKFKIPANVHKFSTRIEIAGKGLWTDTSLRARGRLIVNTSIDCSK